MRDSGGRSTSDLAALSLVLIAVVALGRVAGPAVTGAFLCVAALAGVAVSIRRYRADARGRSFGTSLGRPSFRRAVVAIRRADLLVVLSFLGISAAGRYGAAATITLLVPIAASVAGHAMLTLLRRGDRRSFRDATGGMVRLLALVSVPVTVVLIAFAPDAVRLAFGPGFAPAATALQILAIAFPLSLGSRTLSTAAVAAGEAPLQGRCVAAALGVAVAADLVLVPTLGIAGAAWGTVVFEGAQVLLLLVGLVRAGVTVPAGRELVPALVAGGMLVGSLASFGRGPAGVVAGLLAVAAVVLWAIDHGLLLRLERVTTR